MSTPHTAIDLTTTTASSPGATSLFAAAPASRKRKLEDVVDLTVDDSDDSEPNNKSSNQNNTASDAENRGRASAEDDDDEDRKPAARSTPKQPPPLPGFESWNSDDDHEFISIRRRSTPKQKKKRRIDPVASSPEVLSWDSDDDRDFIPSSVRRRRSSSPKKKKKKPVEPAAAYPEPLGDNCRRRLPVVDEAEDRRLAEQLQAQEEDHYLQAKIQEEQHMLGSTTGKAWKFVEQVLELHKQLLSKSAASNTATANGNDSFDSDNAVCGRNDSDSIENNDISPVAVDDMVFTTERLLQAQDKFRSEGRPFSVDIGYHYTQSANLDRIQTDGLLSRPERDAAKVKSKYNGSAYGEGIYTARDVSYFHGGRYGNMCLMVARLKGISSVSPKGHKYDCNNNSILVTRAKSGLFGTGSSNDDSDNKEEYFTVLQNSSQCIPLVRFASSLIKPYQFDRHPGNQAVHEIHVELQKVVDRFFNDGHDDSTPATYVPDPQTRAGAAAAAGPALQQALAMLQQSGVATGGVVPAGGGTAVQANQAVKAALAQAKRRRAKRPSASSVHAASVAAHAAMQAASAAVQAASTAGAGTSLPSPRPERKKFRRARGSPQSSAMINSNNSTTVGQYWQQQQQIAAGLQAQAPAAAAGSFTFGNAASNIPANTNTAPPAFTFTAPSFPLQAPTAAATFAFGAAPSLPPPAPAMAPTAGPPQAPPATAAFAFGGAPSFPSWAVTAPTAATYAMPPTAAAAPQGFAVPQPGAASANGGFPTGVAALPTMSPSRRRSRHGRRTGSAATTKNEVIQYAAPTSLSTTESVYAFCRPTTDECAICLDSLQRSRDNGKAVSLNVCGHQFHVDCIDGALQNGHPHCPTCRKAVSQPQGMMPSGTMSISRSPGTACGGYESAGGSLVISYSIGSGTQKAYHPNPGQRHGSAHRVAYLPDNLEGQNLLKRLKFAFAHGLTFTIGTSLTSGQTNAVTWSSIHHKTSPMGGMHGFPDPNFFDNCNQELDSLNVPATDDLS